MQSLKERNGLEQNILIDKRHDALDYMMWNQMYNFLMGSGRVEFVAVDTTYWCLDFKKIKDQK